MGAVSRLSGNNFQINTCAANNNVISYQYESNQPIRPVLYYNVRYKRDENRKIWSWHIRRSFASCDKWIIRRKNGKNSRK